jgi:Nif-specific regulatory protein
MRKNKEEYKTTAEELNLDLEEFWNAVLEIKVVSFQGIQSLVELIKDVGEYTIKLAYQSIFTRKEMMMESESPKLSRLLNTLLDVAFQVSGADIGSVMFFDKINDELTIRASRGIPEEVVRNTRVRLGDGISGIAAKERTSFLIDDEVRDNRIRPYLRRPYIGSSMVLPINVERKVMGVMNLGTLKTSTVKFSTDTLQLMSKLIDLATVAIAPTK